MKRSFLSSHTDAKFVTTRWAVVRDAALGDAAGGATALAELCQAYWPPVYAYLRKTGCSPSDAKDLTQGFFAHVLAREFFSLADDKKGRFRTFLLCALRHFHTDQRLRESALKRGGGNLVPLDEFTAEGDYLQEMADQFTPERLFERRWALTLLCRVMQQLEKEFCQGARAELFATLRDRLWGDQQGEPAHVIAGRLGLSESAIHVMMHRLRERLRELIRIELGEQVATPAELDDELAHLIRVLGEV